MTTLTDTQVITASGGLVELGYSQIVADVPTTTTSTGTSATSVIPSMTVVCDGGPVLIEFQSPRVDSGSASNITISLLKDGAEFVRSWGFINPGGTSVPVKLTYRDTPTAGSHTYEVRAYRGGSNNGTIYAGNTTTGSSPAFLRVSKIVQATQWPAVTTGTIICTSSTRPASPFEGQTIYETDTNKEWVYDGAAWYSPGLQREEKNTSQVTVTTAADVAGMTTGSNFTAVSGRKYRATFYCSQAYGTAGERMAVTLLSGSTTFQAGYFGLSPSTGGSVICITGTFTASGVTTVKVRAARDIGTNNAFLYADANSPLTLTVEDIGPA